MTGVPDPLSDLEAQLAEAKKARDAPRLRELKKKIEHAQQLPRVELPDLQLEIPKLPLVFCFSGPRPRLDFLRDLRMCHAAFRRAFAVVFVSTYSTHPLAPTPAPEVIATAGDEDYRETVAHLEKQFPDCLVLPHGAHAVGLARSLGVYATVETRPAAVLLSAPDATGHRMVVGDVGPKVEEGVFAFAKCCPAEMVAAVRPLVEGDKVEVRFRGRARWYPGKIDRERDDGMYDIEYDDGGSRGVELLFRDVATSPRARSRARRRLGREAEGRC